LHFLSICFSHGTKGLQFISLGGTTGIETILALYTASFHCDKANLDNCATEHSIHITRPPSIITTIIIVNKRPLFVHLLRWQQPDHRCPSKQCMCYTPLVKATQRPVC